METPGGIENDNSKRSADMKTDDRARKKGVSANRQKFDKSILSSSSSPSTTATSTTLTTTATPSVPGVKKINRGRTDFGSLLQKFSNSEASGSEKSDNETVPHVSGQPRLNVLRRSLERTASSGSEVESSSFRKTPERSQSLKISEKFSGNSDDSNADRKPKSGGVVADRSSSFKSDFMARRMSGKKAEEPDVRGRVSGGEKNTSLSASGSGSESECSSGSQSHYRRVRNQIVSDMNSTTAATSSSTSSSSSSSTSSSSSSSSLMTTSMTPSVTSSVRQTSSLQRSSQSPTSSSNRQTATSSKDTEANSMPGTSGRKGTQDKHGGEAVSKISTEQPHDQSRKNNFHHLGKEDELPSTYSRNRENPKSKTDELTNQSTSGMRTSSATPLSSSSSSLLTSSASQALIPSSVASSNNSNNNSNNNNSSSNNIDINTTTTRNFVFPPCLTSSASTPSIPTAAAASESTMEAATETSTSIQCSNNNNNNNNNTSASSSVRRAFSFKDVSADHSENAENRRGILKRATSLNKKDLLTSGNTHSGPLLDPQLAKILQQRRQIQGDVKEEEEEEDEVGSVVVSSGSTGVVRRRSRALSAAEEIEENLKYSKERASERGINPEEDETFKRRSVADRIFFMQAKIEEVKQGSSSGSRSGVSTPRSRPRSSPITPTQQRSLDEAIHGSTLSPRSPQPPSASSPTSSSSSPLIRSPCSPSRSFTTAAAAASSSTPVAHAQEELPMVTTASTVAATTNGGHHNVNTSTRPSGENDAKLSTSVEQGHQNDKRRVDVNKDDSSTANKMDSSISPSLMPLRHATPSSYTNGNSAVVANDNNRVQGRRPDMVSSSSHSVVPKLDLSEITGGSNRSSNTSGRAVCGDQLMQKLSEIADATEAYEGRRQRFQHRPKDDWRHRTQPVTLEEIQEADSLETVSSFRALIRKETSTGIFQHIQQEAKPQQQTSIKGKGEGFPQHLTPPTKQQRRSRKSRYNTLPVTAEELKAVPENTELGTEPDWEKYAETLRADSGIEVGSDDVDISAEYANSLRSLTLEMEVDDHDPAAMSVSAKTGIFKAIDEKKNKSASGAKRYINRKKRERSQTMPITEDEVKTAAEIGDHQGCNRTNAGGASGNSIHRFSSRQPEVVNRSKSMDEPDQDDPENDQLTKLSLSEKVKLFSQPKEAEKAVTKPEVPVVRRRNRKQASRFNTQPVTTEEVEKAAASTRISPLAMSMVKPPDPEILKGLPLKDQRQLMAAHAEMCLSQSSSRSQSRSGSVANLESSQNSSRRSSTDAANDNTTTPNAKGILKSDSSKDVTQSQQELHGILKSGEHHPQPPTTPNSKSILKRLRPDANANTPTDSTATSDEEEQQKGILKTTTTSSSEGNNDRDISGHRSRSNSQPSGILKHDDNNTASSTSSLKSTSGSNGDNTITSSSSSSPKPTRGILKTSSQEKIDDGSNGMPSSSLSSSASSSTVKSALRRGSHDNDDANANITSSSTTLKSALKQSSPTSTQDSVQSSEPLSDNGHRISDIPSDKSDASVNNSELSRKDFDSADIESVLEGSSILNSNKDNDDAVDSIRDIVDEDELSKKVCSSLAVDNDGSGYSVDKNKDMGHLGQTAEGQEAAEVESESSSGELLEDTPRSRIKKKRFADRKGKNQRYKSQPAEFAVTDTSSITPEESESGEVTAVKKKHKYEGRHWTQPITDDEMRDVEASTPVSDDSTGGTLTPGSSIAERLNLLKTMGNEEWKKRVDKKDEMITPAELVKRREKKANGDRPKSIADRLNDIEVSKMSWKGRVEESDAKQFTVAGKLGSTPVAADSPLVGKLKTKTPVTKASPACPSPTPTPQSTTLNKEPINKIPIPKVIIQDTQVSIEQTTSITTTTTAVVTTAAATVTKSNSFKSKVSEEEEQQQVKVEVPQVGEDLDDFFHTKPIDEIISQENVGMEIDDFDDIVVDPQTILTNVRKARPTRKTKSSSRNPLKAMAQTIEVKQEYTQQSQGVAEREFKRVKKENLAKDAGFAQAALAGLASKENFKQVELRRSDSNSLAHGQRLDPFNDVMLLQVKGRRSIQTRLVEPHTRSLNAGDCFILVTSEKLVQWEGQFANVIEKAKASEISQNIQQKKDLGCKKATDVQTVTQARDQYGAGKVLWSTLEGQRQCQDCGLDSEDEVYESSMVRSNMVFRLEGNALLPYEDYWGVTLKYEMLKRNEVLVFDFGTEFYLWQGKGVSMDQRKLSLRLAKQLYDKGYDYSEAPINPMSPLRSPENGGLPLKAEKRPKWAIFGKVNQNMETILFREKFSDWPDNSRLIQCKGLDGETSNKELQELKAYDATKMIPLSRVPVTLKLEGADVGRGVKWSEDMQGFIKEQDIITLEVTAWHVLEYEHFKLPVSSHGQFHDGDTYVVRWQYMIANANLRSLKKGSGSSHNSLTGRERCAYFFWQGNHSTINEKGASALMTVELDEERGPQIRVLEGKEPPCFLNLFGGQMILHIGKREEPATNTQGPWRLYCLRGDYKNEMYLLEVPVCVDHLRSRSSLVLLNVDTGQTYIWNGVRVPSHVRSLCQQAVENIRQNIPLELGMKEGVKMEVTEVEEGEEGEVIWRALGKKDRDKYHSLIMNPTPTSTKTLRLFHMSSVNMVFDVCEQLSPCRTNEFTTAFPFLQLDLYTAIQPALFLVDCHHSVFLWQGWWPTASKDHENVHTGSATARFNMDRRLAMETALSYCKEKNPNNPPEAFLVCAGVEPLAFTTLFPYWLVNDAVRELAIEDGKTPGYMEDVSQVLHRVTQTRYTLAELQERPLPEGVDPLKLETYLHDKDFEECLEMTREEFYTQPPWKQRQLKQLVDLF